VIGEKIGILGDQYYPDLVMPAYVFDHRGGWNEDDALAGPIARVLVKSDGGGTVPLTEAWTIDRTGEFDVIIDYDRDDLFTWTIDGLGGFHVVPEPGALSLLITITSLLARPPRRDRA
jgi:hypothetical protein